MSFAQSLFGNPLPLPLSDPIKMSSLSTSGLTPPPVVVFLLNEDTHFAGQATPHNIASLPVVLTLVAIVALARILFHILTRLRQVWVYPSSSPELRETLRSTLRFASLGFTPTPWLFSGHLQTFYSALTAKKEYDGVGYTRETIRAKDGGIFTLDWANGDFADGTPTILLLHGLTGGSQEAYIKSLIFENNRRRRYRCVVFNARGCAGSKLETAQFVRGGSSTLLGIYVLCGMDSPPNGGAMDLLLLLLLLLLNMVNTLENCSRGFFFLLFYTHFACAYM